jgi:hypothetical protein
MHLVTGGTGDLVPGVAALKPAYVRRLIQMAGETDFVGGCSRQLGWIPDIIGGRSFCVCLAGTVTGLAGASLKSTFSIHVHGMVGALGEPVVDVFVTDLANVRSSVAGRKRP